MARPALYYYFAAENERLAYGDDREVVVGETHTVDCEPILCEQGLHASRNILDALTYATTPILFGVKLGGTVAHGEDKSCATERSYLWRLDATDVLKEFARLCVLRCLDIWLDECNPRERLIISEFMATPAKDVVEVPSECKRIAAGVFSVNNMRGITGKSYAKVKAIGALERYMNLFAGLAAIDKLVAVRMCKMKTIDTQANIKTPINYREKTKTSMEKQLRALVKEALDD